MELDGLRFLNTQITTESVEAIDCGCRMSGGRLAAICFETGKEFYSS